MTAARLPMTTASMDRVATATAAPGLCTLIAAGAPLRCPSRCRPPVRDRQAPVPPGLPPIARTLPLAGVIAMLAAVGFNSP
jgi:hypothetical protein